MRYSNTHKQETREKLVNSSRAIAKKEGFDSTGVDTFMSSIGLTGGAFYSHFGSKDELANMKEQFKKGGTGYGDFKKELFEKLWEYFAPMRKRREEILRDKSYINNVLTKGAKRANEIADQVMQRVRKAVGLR